MPKAHEPKADEHHSGEWSGEEPEHEGYQPKDTREPGTPPTGGSNVQDHEVESRRECPYYAETCRETERDLRRQIRLLTAANDAYELANERRQAEVRRLEASCRLYREQVGAALDACEAAFHNSGPLIRDELRAVLKAAGRGVEP